MEIKENFDKLSDTTQRYVDMKVDNLKLHVVEKLSVMCNDVLSYAFIYMFALIAFVFLLIALIAFLSSSIGIVYSAISVATLLVVTAFVLYLFRKRLFLNAMVKCFCRMFFNREEEYDE